ncbi:hypothetical protein CLOP_g9622 [Closterium sp. NIES-67]|nr:hypothetical protein CLOP_g9622 [Closterium sp. NIES-67]
MAWVNCGFCGVWNQCNTKLVCVSCNNVRKDTVDKAARAESRAAQAERRVKDVEADVATLRRKVGGMRDAAFCDVTLQTCDGEAIEAHRCILAAWSPVFTTMFSSGFLEETKGVVSIPDTDSSTVEQLVSFMYRGEFHVESATMKVS